MARTAALFDAGLTVVGVSTVQALDSTSASGMVTRQAATQDAVALLGRAGGSGSHVATITPPTLAGNVTITLPALTSTLATLTQAETFTNKTLTSPAINTATIIGGTINNTSLGATTRNTAAVTTLAANGAVTLTAGTASTTTTTGTAVVTGGVGISGALNVGGAVTLSSGANLAMSGAATLVTGTGLSTFNGQVTISLNAGVGLLPSAWASNHRAIDFGTSNRYSSISQQTTSGALFCLTWNGYGTTGDDLWAYKQTGDLASQLTLAGRTLRFRSAVSGTAGGPITWIDSFVVNQSTLTLADSINIVLNTGTGTKIGTATNQKLGFWNAAPVIQPTAVVDATGGATVDTEARAAINALLARMRTVGMVAT